MYGLIFKFSALFPSLFSILPSVCSQKSIEFFFWLPPVLLACASVYVAIELLCAYVGL